MQFEDVNKVFWMLLIQAIDVGLILSEFFLVPHLGANYMATNVLLYSVASLFCFIHYFS